MIKIKELEINKMYTIPLVVTAATARETKSKKPYLALDLFDGLDSISGNYWDWGGKSIPEKNSILDINAQVTEWQGTKQLNIKGILNNTTLHISEFTPSSGQNISEIYKEAYSFASVINDDFLRSLTLGVLEDYMDLWITTPGANSIHHAYTAGTLIHSLSVARIAEVMAEAIPGSNLDLVIAGGLLHDVGKLFSYRINGVVCEMTDEGLLYEHMFLGASMLDLKATEAGLIKTEFDIAKLDLLRHIILSHHGQREWGAAVPPMCIEAHIVHHADAIDANAEQIREASTKVGCVKWTDRIWALDNRPHLTTSYIQNVMSSTIE